MTIDISNNNPRINYSVAEGVTQTTFSVPFEFFEDGDLTVYVDGVEKTITTDYSVTGGDGSTGTIQFVTADPGETQQVTGASGGSTVTIVRDIPIERTTDFTAGADINRAALNTQLDTIIGLIADVDDRASRSLQLNDYETAASVTLPSLDSRKGYTLAFNASTGDAEVGPLVTDVAAANTHATNAAASATAAAASESNAATSETNAASSATAAATSATSAETSEINAAASETAAASSATNAAASESAAATSASNAATSETNAATSETNAATSATNAASSATSAASAQTAAEAARDATLLAYDNFDDRYLGAKASDPTLDNDGNALVAGSLYFNTTYEEMKVYTGSLWVAAYVSGTGFLAAANNLSDLPSAATARTNLGLGTAATTDSTAYATAAQGSNADTAFGWGNHASAGYLTSITGQSIENLSDVSAMTPAEGQALVYSSGSWSAADMAGGIAYVRKTANYTASANEGIIADTSGGSFTVTLPASPATGDTVIIADGADWSTNNLTVGRNGSTIEGDAADMTMDLGNVSVQFTYDGTTWQAYAQVGVAGDGVTLTGVQTLTNKTLTSPVITSPDIDLGSDATGDILYRNSGGSIARLGIGSTDQVLKVASGLPAWGDAGGAGLEFIATADASSSSSLDFTAFDATKYDGYLFALANVKPQGGYNVYLQMNTSANGGSTWDASSSQYGNSESVYGAVINDPGMFAPSQYASAQYTVGGSYNGMSGHVWLMGPHLATYTYANWSLIYQTYQGYPQHTVGGGYRKSAAAVTGMRFKFSSGYITSGTITMYGYKNA